MSVLFALGQRPYLIVEAFRSQKANEEGFCQIYFYDTDLSRKVMFVDHNFPFVKKDGKLIPLGARLYEEDFG